MTRMSLAERRQKLITAALTVIEEQGLASATTRAIAAQAGMPLASFHYAFESHQALLREAMGALDEAELARLEALEVRGDSTHEVLLGLLDQHLHDVVAQRGTQLSLWELADQALRTPGLEDVPAGWRAKRVALLATKLADQPDPEGLAEALLMLADGVTMRYLMTADELGTRQSMAVWLRQAVAA
ncbi:MULTISPECIES: TetR/AcrR family transcriptional regulator [unclassified Luteococcus]|uniref:TetR/AcrR family transcriptional regulator n=1 Tax=unclassified Luteococcus TaxID=2639923 RepID=UPI00313E0A5C